MKSVYAPAPSFLAWAESVTDRDLTPCHDYENASWHWTGGCEDVYPVYPDATGLSWSSECQPALTQRHLYYGGGEDACAGFSPPFGHPTELVDPGHSASYGGFLPDYGASLEKVLAGSAGEALLDELEQINEVTRWIHQYLYG